MSRIEIIQPPWVKDPSKWPFGNVVLPPESRKVKRLLLEADALAGQLRCPRSLVGAFLRFGQLHEASAGEAAAGLGLCAEDLAALALTGCLCTRHDLPLNTLVFRVLGDLRSELLVAPRPLRVILGVLRANKRIEANVGTCEGPLAVFDCPDDQIAATDFYDASDLRERMDEAIDQQPLDLPRAMSCLVARPGR